MTIKIPNNQSTISVTLSQNIILAPVVFLTAPEEESFHVHNIKLIIDGLHNLSEYYTNGPMIVEVKAIGKTFILKKGHILVQLIEQSPELWHATNIEQKERLFNTLIEPTKNEGAEFAARLHSIMEVAKLEMKNIILNPHKLLNAARVSTLSNDELSSIYQTYHALNDNSPTDFTSELSDLVFSMLVGIEPEILSILQSAFTWSPVENDILLMGDENKEYSADQKEDIF